MNPDQVIWSDEAARTHLQAILLPVEIDSTMITIANEPDFKAKFVKLATATGNIDNLSALHSMFLKGFLTHNKELVSKVLKVLNDALNAAEASNA